MATVLKARLERLACGFDLSDNYFAWQAFGRRYAHEGAGPLPPYLAPGNYETLKARAGNIAIVHASFTEHLAGLPEKSCDAYVLLDAQDWMTDEQLTALWTRDRAHGAAGCARHLPHRGRGDDPSGAHSRRDPQSVHLRPRAVPGAVGQGSLVDLRRLPSLRAGGLRTRWPCSGNGGDAASAMDAIYRTQRHIYDATRKYFLLGRDRMLEGLRRPGRLDTRSRMRHGAQSHLAARLHTSARLFGFDISPAMLETAAGSIARSGLAGRISIAQGDAAQFSGEPLFGAGSSTASSSPTRCR